MHRNYKSILIIILFLLTINLGQAQLKTQVREQPTVEQAIRIPGLSQNSFGLNLFDPSRFFMRQSYSLAMGIGGHNTASQAMYLNNMTYIFSEKLLLNARIGFTHDPLKLGNNQYQSYDALDNLIYGADLTYRPKENMLFKISFDKRPHYYSPYSYYYRRPYLGN